jgi:hypothetical protein
LTLDVNARACGAGLPHVRISHEILHHRRQCIRSAFAVAVSLMLGCAHVVVHDRDDGRHALTAVASSGGYSGSHEEAIEEANDFCAHARHTAVIERFEDSPVIGPQGEHTSSAVFSCAAPPVLRF